MKLGIVNPETWAFFREVYADLAQHHQTKLFETRQIRPLLFRERLNKHLFSRDLRAFLRSHDVVFFEWASELLALASRLPKTCGIVTRLHRYEMYRWADQIEWEAVDRIILVSEAKRREFSARFPSQAAKVAVIPEAISLDRFRPRPRSFSGDIGILCSLIPRKRVYELILSFYELTRAGNGFHLHVAGGKRPLFADYYEALHALVPQLGLEDMVTFYGDVADPREWFGRIDVFVSNSYSEGLQVSPMEAIASGVYCLSHWWQGAEELLPEEDLCRTDRELMDKLLDYCNESESGRQTRRERQRTIVSERFDIERTKVQIRQLVEEVGASRGGGVDRS
jgi:glycosyltransferase involved in cell wall biosynthesis